MAVKKYDEFKSQLDGLIKGMKDKLTKDSSKEEIQAVSDAENIIKSACDDYKGIEDELGSTKDLLIESMKREGSSEQPVDNHSNEEKPKTLLEIAQGYAKENK